MFKETATEKLIEYILTLPDGERNRIAQKIKPQKKTAVKTAKNGMRDFIAYTKPFAGRLPKDYQFNREEANKR